MSHPMIDELKKACENEVLFIDPTSKYARLQQIIKTGTDWEICDLIFKLERRHHDISHIVPNLNELRKSEPFRFAEFLRRAELHKKTWPDSKRLENFFSNVIQHKDFNKIYDLMRFLLPSRIPFDDVESTLKHPNISLFYNVIKLHQQVRIDKLNSHKFSTLFNFYKDETQAGKSINESNCSAVVSLLGILARFNLLFDDHCANGLSLYVKRLIHPNFSEADLLNFTSLCESGLHQMEYIEMMQSHSNPALFVRHFTKLSVPILMNEEHVASNYIRLCEHDKQDLIISLLRGAKFKKCLSKIDGQYLFECMLKHPQPEHLLNVVFRLRGVLQANLKNILACTSLDKLWDINTFHSSYFLDQLALDQAFQLAPFYSDVVNQSLYRIPSHLFTPQARLHIAQMCSRAETQAGFEHSLRIFVNHLLNITDEAPVRQLNHAQSTHNESVHKSTSESAVRLSNCYRFARADSSEIDAVKVKQTLDKVYQWGEQLKEENHKYAAAKRCLQRFKENSSILEYSDPDSKISLALLLALTWCAIHDEHLIKCTIQDAEELFIEALYETQREYNFTHVGGDQGGNDRPSCPGGTFNKLIEKLVTIHPDVEIKHVTYNHAKYKFRVVVKECLLEYLSRLPEHEKELRHKILEECTSPEEGIGDTWKHIESRVSERIFEEFRVVFQEKTNTQFVDLIASGVYLSFPPDELKLKIAPTSDATASHLGMFAASSDPTKGEQPKPALTP